MTRFGGDPAPTAANVAALNAAANSDGIFCEAADDTFNTDADIDARALTDGDADSDIRPQL